MEGKKTIIGIIIVVVLIGALILVSYLNTEQVNTLTEESNKLLQANILEDEIDSTIKTKYSYGTVEKAMKEYLTQLKNEYTKMEELNEEIDSDEIFSAKNIEDKNLEEIEKIIEDYREKSKSYIAEYRELISDEKIIQNINEKEISIRKDYYVDLYKTVMLGEVMKDQYNTLEESLSEKRDEIYDKLNIIERIKKYLEDNKSYWSIKEEKIQFTNISKMTGYYDLINELSD